MSIAATAETEHVGDDLRRPRPSLLDAIKQLRHFAALQVAVDRFQLDARLLRMLQVLGQVGGQAAADVLHVVQDRSQRVVDLMGHAGSQATHGEHLLRLHHHFFQRQTLSDVIDTDHHAAPGPTHQRVEGQGVMLGFVVLEPGDAFDAFHGVLFYRCTNLRQVRLERLERQVDRLVQGFVQACAGEGAGFLVPLGDVKLFIQGDQRRGHRVDDAVQVILEAGEFLLDLAANLHFQFQLAVGVARFFRQALRLVIRRLGVVPRAFELLLTGFDARQHGVEGFGQAADLIVIATAGAQGVVLFAGDLTREFFQLVDWPGDQAFDLTGDDQPQQHAENQDAQAGRQRAGIKRHRQLATGDQQ